MVALGTSAGAATGSETQAQSSQVAVVASVYDGDTLTLRDGRRVRLLQIDTPELGSGECYSRAARTALVALAPPGKRVVLETDPRLDRVDRYGRLLRYVKRNGVNVNLELARRGAAAPYFYRGDRGRYAGSLMRAALGAKAAKRGLWKACPSTRARSVPCRGDGPKRPADADSGSVRQVRPELRRRLRAAPSARPGLRRPRAPRHPASPGHRFRRASPRRRPRRRRLRVAADVVACLREGRKVAVVVVGEDGFAEPLPSRRAVRRSLIRAAEPSAT